MATPRKKFRPTLKTKMEIIERMEGGETASHLARLYKVNESTIRSINKNAGRIRQSLEHSSVAAKVASRVRNPLLVRMEHRLAEWIRQNEENEICVNGAAIRDKALEIFNALKDDSNSQDRFQASKGWYENFRRKRLPNINRIDDSSPVPDTEAVTSFFGDVKKIMAHGNFTPQQVFTVHEFFLFWKRLPNRVYESPDCHLDPVNNNERIAVLLCKSADGYFKFKPSLVYHTQYPYAMHGKSLNTLPVHWSANHSMQITPAIFENWFVNCFCVDFDKGCSNGSVDNKAVLILDSGLEHFSYLNDLKPNVKMVFAPPQATEALRPLHEDVVSQFKAGYYKCMFNQIRDSQPKRPDQVVDGYSILDAIVNIVSAWDEIPESGVNQLWSSLCEDRVLASNCTIQMNDTLVAAKNVNSCGFGELKRDDLNILFDCNLDQDCGDPSSSIRVKEETITSDDFEVSTRPLPSDGLMSLLELLDQVNQDAKDLDPNAERRNKFCKMISTAMSTYMQIYKNRAYPDIK